MQGTLRAVVASSSLELGVDFEAVDQVLLVGTPRGVSRALQRLGRSGHRVGGVASGALVPLSLPDTLQAVALRRAAAKDVTPVPQATSRTRSPARSTTASQKSSPTRMDCSAADE